MDQDKSSVVPGDDDRVVTMTSTAISSWMSTVDLVEGLRARREAPTSWLEGVRSNYLINLVTRALNAYLTLFMATGGANLRVKLTKAIELYREAVVLLPSDHPNRADTCANLGCFLYAHYEWTRNIALLDEAIELQREALALRPLGHPDREISCVILSCSLLECYIRTGGAALLDESIRLQREELELRPPGHPDRALSCVTLRSSLRMSYQQVGDVTLLDEEIELEREALALQPPGHPNDRALTCVNLGSSLHDSYHQTGNVALLDEAIKLQREALESSPPGDPARASSCSALAVSLSVRYQHAGDLTQLDEAIELHREALFLQPPGDPDRVNGCANLVTALQVRYPDQTSHTALLDEVIELKREALALQTLSRPDRAKTCDELGAYLLIRYEPTGDVALLDEAIKLQREGLALRPPEHPNRAACYASLANSLHMLCKRTDNVALVNEAMDASSYASEHLPASKVWMSLSRLSQLYLLRSNPRYSILKALEHIHHSFQHEADDIRSFMYAVCHIAALVWDNSGVWSPQITALLVDVYAKIVDRLPLVAGFVLDMSSRLQSLKLANRIGSDACVAALLVEQPAAAVTLLDRAHGVIWTQALHQRDPRMEGAPRDLAGELEDLLRRIATSAPVDPARVPGLPQDFRYRQNIRIQALLREIRAMPGLARFMLGSTYETLREAARDHPVVVLVAARDHAFALIMSSSAHAGPDILRLDVANDTLQSFANSVEKTNLRYRGCTLSRQDVPLAESVDLDRAMRPGDHPTRRSPLARLWLSVVKPVLIHLGLTKQKDLDQRRRLHWCTAGDFASLPVHAAGIYAGTEQECCADYAVSSYTPTLTSLLRARRDLQPVPTADAKLLLVAADHAATTKLPALAKVQAEMSEISGIADRAGVPYAAPSRIVSTPEEATAALPSATLVHIACHGLQNPGEPLESAFYLSDDGVLSMSNIMELDLKGAYLAFLSACETAKGDRVQSDQAIHLAATMLFVGFKSVVATMWAMRDDDGPVVSKAFYEKLLEGDTITADAIPYALDHAVRTLRESGASVERWATFIHVGA